MPSTHEIDRLREAIRAVHGCAAEHVETVSVRETLPDGTVVWDGDVEVFRLTGHPKATRCYAWSHLVDEETEKRRYVSVLELPPVTDAVTAVRASIVADWKSRSPN